MGTFISVKRSCAFAGVFLGGMMAASPAFALNLNIWGVGHLSVDNVDDGVDSAVHIASNSSRLAFSGDQDIDHNLKVVFQYENGVDLTGQGGDEAQGGDGNGGPGNQSGGIFTNTRDAWVGLAGGFGTLHLGRVPGLNQWVYDYNLFADQVGDLGNIWGGTGLAGRVSNSIEYITPNLGPVVLKVVYAPDEGVDETEIAVFKGDADFGGVKLGLAYMSQGQGVGAQDHIAGALTGSYTVKAFSIGAGYQSESDIGGTSGADSDSFTVGGSVGLGKNGTLKAQYTAFSGTGASTDAAQVAVGYDHSIGKNTTVYLAYASTDNDPNTNFTANNYGHGDAVTPLDGNDPAAFSLGLVYKFNAAIMKNK